MATAAATLPRAAPGAWAPLRERSFAILWLAGIVSNVGTWMHDVAAAWLMTSLAPAPLMVALVQAATSLPIFLFALPAGALADLVDRRRMLITLQLTAAGTALVLALVVGFGLIDAWLLLLLTFLLGVTAALSAPAWQATVPELAPQPLLSRAVALNGVGINLARAIGPALGGLIITTLGLVWAFVFNVASFFAVIGALVAWRRPAPARSALPAERFAGAIRSGLRYARSSPALKATLVRSGAFFLFASAFWALLPLVARGPLAGGPGLYGGLLAAVGVGAVTGAFVLPGLKGKLGADRVVAGCTAALALAMAVLALVPLPAAALAACLLAGLAWIGVLSSLNVSAQLSLPAWVRSRGLAVHLTVFFGSMTLGSILWGAVGNATGLPLALLIAAAGALLGIVATRGFRLQGDQAPDLGPSAHWPQPIVAEGVDTDHGPVLVTVEYEIEPEDGPAFAAAMQALGEERRRDGAVFWQLFTDAENTRRRVETFMLESWLEHLRQHERVTRADRAVQDRVRAFHRGDGPPRVTHLVASG